MDELPNPPKHVQVGPQELDGELMLFPQGQALVVFAHGSGSSRRSPRNLQVAQALHRRGLGTLLFDLLTPDEAAQREPVFDIELLARRLIEALDWIDRRPALARLPIGLFGASTGAAAALMAAAARPERVYAVVSRGGRPDLAVQALPRVEAPTRLIVGGADTEVLELNRRARTILGGKAELCVVLGATHLFEETGALKWVGDLAAEWFVDQLPRRVVGALALPGSAAAPQAEAPRA